jgi:hypothetical protein
MPDFEEWLLAELWHPMLQLDPPYRALRGTWTQLVGRQIRNQVAFEIYAHSVNGWMIHASDFGRRLLEILERIKQDHRREFRRNRWRDIKADPGRINVITNGDREMSAEIRQQIAIDSTNRDCDQYKRLWDRYFPSSREQGIPSHADIDTLKRRLARIGRPIRDHRNTIAAHPEAANKLPASWRHIQRAFIAQRAVVSALYFLRTRGSLLFDLPSAEAEADATAAALARVMAATEHRG